MTLDGPDAPRPVLAHLPDETNGGATSSTLASVVARSRRHGERRLRNVTGVSISVALAVATSAAAAVLSSPSHGFATQVASLPGEVSYPF